MASRPAPHGHGGCRQLWPLDVGQTRRPAGGAALRNLLLVSSLPKLRRTHAAKANERSFFAFKLHQFISGAGHAFATLEAPGRRVVTVEGQQFCLAIRTSAYTPCTSAASAGTNTIPCV